MPSIMLPSDLFQSLRVASDAEIDLIFAAYESPTMFKRAVQENSNFSVASSIITAALSGHGVSNLITNVTITLPLLSEVKPCHT